ncbi:GNAT family N-acetyltransferase [Roseibium sp. CAU 1637]|uniref:GNAT family N-acetyltransferase n=1 Tax=Roseibium limicola TaxID=2816037 RepID=A0A939EL82_9HYPH|nr:GNAT family N-acetyltransferase [Roseibium limicola]MBO0344639.1 GNAT family N-acetyltransferase [Roseibium limicola]
MPDYSIRSATEDDLTILLSWAADEGWNPGLDDRSAFQAADPSGFYVGCIGGTPVTCISAVKYGTDFGFIGFYICHPDHRGNGYGWKLWQHAMASLDERTVGLDGVVEQQANYKASGFEFAHRTIRQSGISMVDTPMDPRLTTIGQGLFPSIRDYDLQIFRFPRVDFLKSWLDPMASSRRGFALVDDGEVKGYGTLRQCAEGFKIGPLFADTADIADTLFRALAGQVKGQVVFLDTPEPNTHAEELAERYELSPEFETARMYKGKNPNLPLDHIYGVTSFELG